MSLQVGFRLKGFQAFRFENAHRLQKPTNFGIQEYPLTLNLKP